MRSKIEAVLRKASELPVLRVLILLFKRLWMMLAHNFRYKVLALLLAIFLWNYVVTSNVSITRTKTLTGISGYVSGQSALSAYGLAMKEDPAEQLSGVSVMVEASRADLAFVTKDNVQVTLDLSGVRSEGVQTVPLKANTSYGRVKQIVPEELTVTFEPLDSRVLPVTTQLTGTQSDELWYSIARTNPANLTVSGAASLVRSVDKVLVEVDVTEANSPFSVAEDHKLLDRDGNELPRSMISRSSSSVSVSVDVYPKRELPISTDPATAVVGNVAENYEIESITIQPQTLVVAGEAELLDGISELYVEPVDVEGASQSFSVRAEVSALSSLKYVSAEDVYVNVNIVEKQQSVWLEDVKVNYSGVGDGLRLTGQADTIRVCVTGPISAVEALEKSGLLVQVDLTGLEEGEHMVEPVFPTEVYPELTFVPENEKLIIELTKDDIGG